MYLCTMFKQQNILSESEIAEAKKIGDLFRKSKRVVITSHMSPDGDAMGSSLALANVLTKLGASVRVFTPDEPNHNLMFLPGADRVLYYSRYQPVIDRSLGSCDTLVSLDYNSFSRLSWLTKSAAC